MRRRNNYKGTKTGRQLLEKELGNPSVRKEKAKENDPKKAQKDRNNRNGIKRKTDKFNSILLLLHP
jgi:hypothetical protein